MFNQSLFSVTPETFDSVDIDFSSRKSFGMVNLQRPVSTKHERIIALKFISKHDATSSYSLYRKVQNRFCSNVLQNVYSHTAVSFQYSKDRDLIFSSPSPGTFPFSSKVRFINLDFSLQKVISSFTSRNNSHSYKMNSLKHCRITKFNLLCDPPGRDFKFKQFQDPEPPPIRDSQTINPSFRKVSKGVSAFATTISFTSQSVNFIALTSYAETTVVFPTQLYKEQPCSVFASNKGFKAFYSHLHHYNRCQMFYNYQILLF